MSGNCDVNNLLLISYYPATIRGIGSSISSSNYEAFAWRNSSSTPHA